MEKESKRKLQNSDNILVERWPGGIPRDLCEPIQAGRVWKPKVSRYKVPEILTTCKEAREAAKDVYKLSFEKELRGRTIWVNFMRDTIVFEDAYALAVFQGMVGVSGAHRAVGKFHGKIPPEKTVMEKKLRHLVVYDLLDKHLIELLSRFQSLERIVLQKGAIYSGVGPGIRYLVGYEDTTHLESELMERWSKLKTLPELESGDAMDMLHEYWDTHTIPVSMISLHF
jgi:hypothetical protein